MKTQEVLEQYRQNGVHIPKDWAVKQSSSGEFLGFIPGQTSVYDVRSFEKLKAEKEAIRESKLLQV